MKAFPKPHEAEGRISLTTRQCRDQLERKVAEQKGLCAICGKSMFESPSGFWRATRDHIKPQPAGCFKNDRDSNIQAVHWICNAKRGSKRIL